MTFERPEWLALAPLAALLFAFAVGAHWRRLRVLARAYESAALRRLLPATLDRFPTGRFLCLVGAGVFIGLAAAGPTWLDPEPPEPPQPLDLAIVVDLSLSMTATDVVPSRIGRVRETIDLLAEELPSVRLSMVVFAGWPYTLMPPTDDPDVIRYFTPSLQPEVAQAVNQGTELSATLELARRTLESRPTPGARQAILILSDGDIHENEEVLARAATDAADAGFSVWVAGVGTEDGAPIAIDGEPVQDVSGRPVVVRRNAELLRAVAAAGDGRYEDISDDAGRASLVDELREASGETEAGPGEPFDTTALLALLAIPLLLWEGRLDAGQRSGADKEPESVA